MEKEAPEASAFGLDVPNFDTFVGLGHVTDFGRTEVSLVSMVVEQKLTF